MSKQLTILALVAIGACVLGGLAASRADGTVTITMPAPDEHLGDGPNVELAKAKCTICHSTDYIYTQAPMTSTQWTAEVTKMQKVYGAPIADSDIPLLVQYLMSQNGKPG